MGTRESCGVPHNWLSCSISNRKRYIVFLCSAVHVLVWLLNLFSKSSKATGPTLQLWSSSFTSFDEKQVLPFTEHSSHTPFEIEQPCWIAFKENI